MRIGSELLGSWIDWADEMAGLTFVDVMLDGDMWKGNQPDLDKTGKKGVK